MQEYIDFLVSHWGLSLLFILAFIWVIIVEAKTKATNGIGVTPKQAVDLINKEKATVLDTRDKEKFKSGHIVGAQQVDASKLKDEAGINLLKLKKEQHIIVACYKGIGAQAVVKRLRQQGYSHAVVLTGGMDGWRQAELPTIKS